MQIVDELLEWDVSRGSSYRAHLKISVHERYKNRDLIMNRKLGPNYESLWADQKMTGLIIVGSSLRSFSRTLLENYVSYFEGEGFHFSPLEVEDFESFFKGSISSCDWIIS